MKLHTQNLTAINFVFFASNFLFLNDSKNDLMVLTPHGSTSYLLDSSALLFDHNQTVLNLGIKIDLALEMDTCISQILKSCFYQLGCLTKLKPILKCCQLESIIHVFITLRLD